MENVQVVARSGNSKTGDIPVTYRPKRTCEPTCPLLDNGCYGTGRIFGIAEKYAGSVSIDDARAKLAKRSKTAKYLRDRVVGDIVDISPDGTVSLDLEYVETVASLATEIDLVPFGYTHAWRRMTGDDVARIARSGYVLNASCETAEDIEAAAALGMPTTVANDHLAEGSVIGGRRVVTCPAQTRENVSCASCGLCAKPNRAATVRFLIHGTAKRKASAAIDAAEAAARVGG